MTYAKDHSRAKLSHDPNNTAWSRSSKTYGQRILKSQGWKSGDVLGAQNPKYASHHTSASRSLVKIVLKDDTLGVGAKPRVKGEAETRTGLDDLQDVLGRLNGRCERQVARESKAVSHFRRSEFLERKWGKLQFVKGGFLAGSEPPTGSQEHSSTEEKENVTEEASTTNREASSLERAKGTIQKSRKSKKRKAERTTYLLGTSAMNITSPSATREESQASSTEALGDNETTGKATKRAIKAKSKLKRRQDKEQQCGVEKKGNTALNLSASMREEAAACSVLDTEMPLTENSALYGGRHAVRQRQIRHKKMCLMDSKALNEVS